MFYFYKVTYLGRRTPTFGFALGASPLDVGFSITSKHHSKLLRKYGSSQTTVYKLI